MKKTALFLFLITFAFASPNNILIESIKSVDRFMAIPEEGIPGVFFKKAKAVAIIPNVIRGGFVLGGRYGRGVILFKTSNGWSNPLFIKFYGASVGWQIGLESIDVVLFFLKEQVFKNLLNGEFTLGVDASIAVGPVGRSVGAGSDIKLNSEIYSYSKSKGAFIGIALAGAKIDIDEENNAKFYKKTYIRLSDIFDKKINNRYLKALKSRLKEYSSW